jgi:hypothetical protein
MNIAQSVVIHFHAFGLIEHASYGGKYWHALRASSFLGSFGGAYIEVLSFILS